MNEEQRLKLLEMKELQDSGMKNERKKSYDEANQQRRMTGIDPSTSKEKEFHSIEKATRKETTRCDGNAEKEKNTKIIRHQYHEKKGAYEKRLAEDRKYSLKKIDDLKTIHKFREELLG
ncbi:hypothetical protein Tco_0661056 [Tanacetum coccineum]